jgi:hypothetical protein
MQNISPPDIREMDVVELLVDTENYRIGRQPNQPEAIRAMIAEPTTKLIDLAKDILKHGLSPFDLITVCPADEPGRFRVIEGNRRVTVLKLLNEPALANGTVIETQIRKIAIANAGRAITKCNCVVLESKEAAFIWIQRKHDTGLGGAATIPWGAIAVRRSQQALGHRRVTLDVLDYVMKNPALTDPQKAQMVKMPVTNLERILEDPEALAVLGMEVRNGELVCTKDEDWTREVLTQIVSDIASKKVRVKHIFDKTKRAKYVKTVAQHAKHPATKVAEWAVANGGVVGKPGSNQPKGPRPKPLPTDRKRLIPMSCRLQIPHPRINKIYDELRRRLNVHDVTNSVAVLFRVFVDLSAEYYITQQKLSSKDDKLNTKLRTIAEYFKQQNLMTDKELKPIRLALSNRDNLLSTETLNAYVHHSNVPPAPQDLIRAWDSIEPFMSRLWA